MADVTNIKLDYATGKVLLKDGKPPCECCANCPVESYVCVRFHDAVCGSQDIVLTGGMDPAYSFTGEYCCGTTVYPVILVWDVPSLSWRLIYNGIPLITGASASGVYTGATAKCNPVGLTLDYDDAIISVDAEVMSFGTCAACSNQTQVCLDIFWWDGTNNFETVILTGDLNIGQFTGSAGGAALVLKWQCGQWVMTLNGSPMDDGPFSPGTTRCNPLGVSFGLDSAGPPTEATVTGWGPDCCACPVDITDVCLSEVEANPIPGDPDIPYDSNLGGSLCSASPGFTDGFFTLEWLGDGWSVVHPSGSFITNVSGDRCNPIGESFEHGTRGDSDWWKVDILEYPCTTCTPDYSAACFLVHEYDGVTPTWSYYTLYGSLSAGYFSNGTITIEWNGTSWVATVTGVTITTYNGATTACDLSLLDFSDGAGNNSAPEGFWAFFEYYGECLCDCAPIPATASITINYGVTSETVELTAVSGGNACGDIFEGSTTVTGAADDLTLEWSGTEWTLTSADRGLQCAVTASTDICNPDGEYNVCCPTNVTSFFAVWSGTVGVDFPYQVEFTGSAEAGLFTCTGCPGTVTLEWDGSEWKLNVASVLYSAAMPMTDQCMTAFDGNFTIAGGDWVQLMGSCSCAAPPPSVLNLELDYSPGTIVNMTLYGSACDNYAFFEGYDVGEGYFSLTWTGTEWELSGGSPAIAASTTLCNPAGTYDSTAYPGATRTITVIS